ncbi:hypothetical protein [Methanotorris formicicus]|uniref:Uncharacterized protein n=1 Tax=Methanotorris formicicus Mc-S-70 TaxID=647171 RepID=H1KY66_9EURY|nr:hypothetical protein [Methanotorris formicicus]EHP87426.1 hypothetical protein MetfoDRAFT_0739 [Methanotorris formicicus Mc-S-70]
MMLYVPYLVFEVNGKEYMIDAYFSKKLEKIERVSALIKPIDRDLPKTAKNHLPILLKENELEEFLKKLFVEVYEQSGERLNARLKHMRRWNIFRFIGIPVGFLRHIKREEDLAKENRETMLSLAILRKILDIKNPEDINSIKITAKYYLYYKIEIKGNQIFNEKGKDIIYTQLLEIDNGFKKSFNI